MAERRNDERNRLREASRDEIAELRDTNVEDETSEVDVRMADVAAKTAARTARHLSKPDSDAPERQAWHRTPAGKAGAILALLSALGAVIKALQEVGVLK